MPDDFMISGDNPLSSVNHICQNVSPLVSGDVATMLREYLYGKYDDKIINSNMVKISNWSDSTEILDQLNTTTVDAFYD